MTLGWRLELSLCDPTQAPFLYRTQNSAPRNSYRNIDWASGIIHMHGIVWLFRLELVKGNKFIGIFFTIFQKKGVSQTDDSALKGRIFKGGGGGTTSAVGASFLWGSSGMKMHSLWLAASNSPHPRLSDLFAVYKKDLGHNLSFQLIIPDYPVILSHRRSTTFPLETYPLHSQESFPTTFF